VSSEKKKEREVKRGEKRKKEGVRKREK